jgi:hypothetical protein
MARVEDWDGTLLLQAGTGSITYKVFRQDSNANTETGTGTLVIADVIFDTAQTDSGWPYDAGFNFKTLLPASAFPTGGRTYRIEIIITPSGSEPFPVVFDAFAQNLLTS